LGVLVSVFAVTAFAADCKVNDSDLSGEYVGGCVNGLAQGRGKAKGRDTYEGDFKLGSLHGKGRYTWSDGATYEGDWLNDERTGKGLQSWTLGGKYEGEFQKGKRHGFGKMTIPKIDTGAIASLNGKGKWVGETYLVEGIFKEESFVISCTSPQNCKQEQAKREAQERRDQAARDEQYRRDAPARQARQMCEAQKQTCFASCPQWRDGANNYAAFSCEKDCQKISCN
jgi:hypothetical protein